MQFWAGIIGALVGGCATLAATWLTGYQSRQSTAKAQTDLIAATALMMQDDFYHYEATLARALDRCNWWLDQEVLKQQTSLKDRKLVWAALPKEPIGRAIAGTECFEYLSARAKDIRAKTTTFTNAVADAQGWIDYLDQRRMCVKPAAATRSDVDLMRRTLAQLDVGRTAIRWRSHRRRPDRTPQRRSAVLAGSARTLDNADYHDELPGLGQ